MKSYVFSRTELALVFLLLMAPVALAEEHAVGTSPLNLGGGHFTIGAGWTSPNTVVQEDFSGTPFEPAEATVRSVYEVNEGLLKGTNLMPSWEEMKKDGALKKTFYF